MHKKFLLIIVVLLSVILAIAVILNVKKKGASLSGENAKSVAVSSAFLSTKAKELEAKGELLQAKSVYQELINDFANSNEVANWQKKVDDINIRLLFSKIPTPISTFYEIKPGDTLNKIAQEFKTTPELIMKANNISGDKIFPGRKIKVNNVPFSIVVDKSQNILILKANEEIIKTYFVSTGANNSTPVGNFKIVNKLENPIWFKAGAVVPANSPENILGTRWMGFDLAGYGIHGTTDPQSIGRQVTQGCIRMSNADVEELYTIIPIGTEVTVID